MRIVGVGGNGQKRNLLIGKRIMKLMRNCLVEVRVSRPKFKLVMGCSLYL
jgi:hypothetical protein